MLFLWTCHFVSLLVILWYRAIRISSFTRRRHLLSFCHQIEKLPSAKPHPEDTFVGPESTWSNKPRSKMVKEDRAVLSSVVFPPPVATAEVGSTLFELFSSSICTGTAQRLFCFNNRERIK
jgi:hypothetical protein